MTVEQAENKIDNLITDYFLWGGLENMPKTPQWLADLIKEGKVEFVVMENSVNESYKRMQITTTYGNFSIYPGEYLGKGGSDRLYRVTGIGRVDDGSIDYLFNE